MECDDPVAELARERFGIPHLHPLQRLVIANILEAAAPARIGEGGEEETDRPPPRQLVLLPTGAGKSLCFQLPALLLPGPTLAVYPLLALMEDQRRRLDELGIGCVVFRGGQPGEEREKGLEDLAAGRSRVALANPEVLAGGALSDRLAELGIAHLAIDEAHCVSEWGESFRPAYLGLGELAERLKPAMVSAFTATASPRVVEAVTRHLFGGREWRLVQGNPDRPNIANAVLPTLSRARSLLRLLGSEARPLIVFASSRRGVENIAGLIRQELPDLDLRFYHAGLEKAEKRAVEAWFLPSEEGVLVATCAYGMGVDKKNVRTVIHWELPGSVEAYVQEAGRAGRDGGPARALLLAGADEEERSARLAGGAEGRKREGLLAWSRSKEGCRREGLLALLGSELEGSCSGCDRCAEEAATDFEGAAEILAFLAANPRRYDLGEALARLADQARGDPPLSAGLGLLGAWARDEIAEALRALARLGRIRVRDDPPWKGRLEIPRRRLPRAAARRLRPVLYSAPSGGGRAWPATTGSSTPTTST